MEEAHYRYYVPKVLFLLP